VKLNLFWRSFAVQALGVVVLFGILIALPLPKDFFEDYGYFTGPLAWIAVTIMSARVLPIPAGIVLFNALAGGVAGFLVGLVAGHAPGLVISLLVFAASCSGYDPELDDDPATRTQVKTTSS
jgi:hypothetical protein